MTTSTTAADLIGGLSNKKRSVQDSILDINCDDTSKTVQNKHMRQEACICSITSSGSEKVCRHMPKIVDLCTLPEVPPFVNNTGTKITSRYIRSYAGYSMQGFCPGNNRKQNQDSLIMLQDPKTGALLIVCLDGHGLYGEKVSRLFKAKLEAMLFRHSLFESDAQAAITSVLETIEDELRGGVDGVTNAGQYSGSTMTMALLRGDSLLTANIGDSRIILARQRKHHHHHHHHRERSSSTSSHRGGDKEKHCLSSPDMVATSSPPATARHKHSHRLAVHQLTNDHKPDQRDEHARILSCGGRVFSVRYDDGVVGPPRVWLGSSNSPGLAMSRSLGDFVVHQVGVLSTPEFCETRLDPTVDCFLVLASDGLWDVMSNAEVVAMVDRHVQPHKAVHALLVESHARWMCQEELSDDTSICVVHLRSYLAAGGGDVTALDDDDQ